MWSSWWGRWFGDPVDSARIADPSHTWKPLGLVPGISVDAGPPSGEHRVPTLGDRMQPRLRGRRSECDVLDDLLARVRTGAERGAGPSRRGGDREDSAARPSRR